MDVNLKKGYNNGWIANAEAGGGSHHRYRLRGFGLGYNKNFRLAAYGLMNNINETGTPGQSGSWNGADGTDGTKTSKGGGIDYGFFPGDKHIELTGNASAKYIKSELNTLTNIQNFLSSGDTYTRRWDDNLDRNLDLQTEHSLLLRPKNGNSYLHRFNLSASYGTVKTKSDKTEGLFGSNIGDNPSLRSILENGWPDGMDAINRYLQAVESNLHKFNISGGTNHLLSILGTSQGFTLFSSAYYEKISSVNPNYNNYLVQYAGGNPSVALRSNPYNSHEYNYMVGTEWVKLLSSNLYFIPRIEFGQHYIKDDNKWYTYEGSDSLLYESYRDLLPSARERVAVLMDPRNSYTTGRHLTTLRTRLQLSYDFIKRKNDKKNTEILTGIDGGFRYLRDAFDFSGMTDRRVVRNYIVPDTKVYFTIKLHRLLHFINVQYTINGDMVDPMNLIDVEFDTDPLNLRRGNPDLKQNIKHGFRFNYSNSNWMLNRIKMAVSASLNIVNNAVAMSYSYNQSTGVRIYTPINIDGNRSWTAYVSPTVALDRPKKLLFVNSFQVSGVRSVDMMSYDSFSSSRKNIVNSLYIVDNASLKYNVKKFMVALNGGINTRKVTSPENIFSTFRVSRYNYGLSGRVSLPAGFEISSDINMYSTRGYDYSEMNTNQLVWNGRISKSFLKGNLIAAVDGYDILGRVKSISYNVNEQGRTETWVNSIPSYVMLSLRWNFDRKPRE